MPTFRLRMLFLTLGIALGSSALSAQAPGHPGIQTPINDQGWDNSSGGGGAVDCATTTVSKEKCICACIATFKAEVTDCQGTTNERNACVIQAAIRNGSCQNNCF
jgi:hypothetical protein